MSGGCDLEADGARAVPLLRTAVDTTDMMFTRAFPDRRIGCMVLAFDLDDPRFIGYACDVYPRAAVIRKLRDLIELLESE